MFKIHYNQKLAKNNDLKGLTMAGGVLGNQVKTRRTMSSVLYMFKKLSIPFVTTIPATESPGSIAAKLCVDNGNLIW